MHYEDRVSKYRVNSNHIYQNVIEFKIAQYISPLTFEKKKKHSQEIILETIIFSCFEIKKIELNVFRNESSFPRNN